MPRFHDLPLERQLTAIVVATTMAGMLLASVAIVAYPVLTFMTFHHRRVGDHGRSCARRSAPSSSPMPTTNCSSRCKKNSSCKTTALAYPKGSTIANQSPSAPN